MSLGRLTAGVFALLLVAAGAAAQPGRGGRPGVSEATAGAGSIRGRVVLPGGESLSRPVKLTLSTLRGDDSLIYTDAQGGFELRGVPAGEYTLEAEPDAESRFEPVSTRVQVNRGAPTLVTLYLKERRAAGGAGAPAGPVVSAEELAQKVPAAAEKEFERAAKAGQKGKPEEAVAHLRRALALFPDYLEALNDLGTYLLALGRLDEAASELRRAVALAPKAFNPLLNLGIVLVEQGRFADAAGVLEKALALDPRSPAARLYAGRAHLALGASEQAEKELRAAHEFGGGRYALALFHLGQLYMERGERELARSAFEAYLREAPDDARAGEARRLIGILR